MSTKIVIDGNSIGYAAHSVRELTVHGKQVQAIFFTLKMIKAVIDRFGQDASELIVLWDSRAKWRYEIFPEYKGKRDDSPEKVKSRAAYKEQTPVIRKMLSMLGVAQWMAQGEEADDLGAAIVHNREPGQKIVLVSGDKDWLQLVCPDVIWFDPREEGRLITAMSFEEKTGYANPVLFSQAKAVLGDSSDNINGVEGVGEKCLALLFQLYGSIPKFIQWSGAHASHASGEFDKGDLPEELSRWRKKLSNFAYGDGLEVFKRNMQLMNLLSKRHRSTEIIEKIVKSHSPMDMDGFIDKCHELSFASIVKNEAAWKQAFEKFAK